MYSIHLCRILDMEYGIYDEKIKKEKLEYFIDKYSLINNGETCEYWINNVEIIKNKNKETFNYITDIDIQYNDTFIIHEYLINECNPFLFYNVDIKEEYILYNGLNNDVRIILKEFSDYLTVEFISNDIDTLKTLNVNNH